MIRAMTMTSGQRIGFLQYGDGVYTELHLEQQQPFREVVKAMLNIRYRNDTHSNTPRVLEEMMQIYIHS